jgi:hypothetical protein
MAEVEGVREVLADLVLDRHHEAHDGRVQRRMHTRHQAVFLIWKQVQRRLQHVLHLLVQLCVTHTHTHTHTTHTHTHTHTHKWRGGWRKRTWESRVGSRQKSVTSERERKERERERGPESRG